MKVSFVDYGNHYVVYKILYWLLNATFGVV